MGRTLWRRRDGQSLVEFALLLPVLLILVFGIVEFGLLLYNKQVITNASREGARYGIVSRTPRRSVAEIDSVVKAYLGNRLITSGDSVPGISVQPDPSAGTEPVFGDDLTVGVRFHYDFFALPGFITSLIGGVDLQAYTTMKYE